MGDQEHRQSIHNGSSLLWRLPLEHEKCFMCERLVPWDYDGSDVWFIHGSWPYGMKNKSFSSSGAWLSHRPRKRYSKTNHTYNLYWRILICRFASTTANPSNLVPRQSFWLYSIHVYIYQNWRSTCTCIFAWWHWLRGGCFHIASIPCLYLRQRKLVAMQSVLTGLVRPCIHSSMHHPAGWPGALIYLYKASLAPVGWWGFVLLCAVNWNVFEVHGAAQVCMKAGYLPLKSWCWWHAL